MSTIRVSDPGDEARRLWRKLSGDSHARHEAAANIHHRNTSQSRPSASISRVASGHVPEPVKRRIVEHLACYRTHAEVVDLIADEFGVSLSPRHVRAYDPMSFQFAAGEKWREYDRLVRDRFATEIDTIAISHRAWRLRRLTEDYYRAVEAEPPDLETGCRIL